MVKIVSRRKREQQPPGTLEVVTNDGQVEDLQDDWIEDMLRQGPQDDGIVDINYIPLEDC